MKSTSKDSKCKKVSQVVMMINKVRSKVRVMNTNNSNSKKMGMKVTNKMGKISSNKIQKTKKMMRKKIM